MADLTGLRKQLFSGGSDLRGSATRADINPSQSGSFRTIGKELASGILARKAAGNPVTFAELQAVIDPDGGTNYVSEADLYRILAGLGVRGIVIAAMITTTVTISAATASLSVDVQVVPGMCMVVQFATRGSPATAAQPGVQYSSPTTISNLKVANSTCNNGNDVPFVQANAQGKGRLFYTFKDSDGTGQKVTATINCDFVATDGGTAVVSFFSSEDAAMVYLENLS